jgi:dienelactone hydrolase
VSTRPLAALLALLLAVGCDDALVGAEAGPPDDAGGAPDAGGASDPGSGDRPEDYPVDPFAALTPIAGSPTVYRGTSSFGGGVAQFQVWAPDGYTRAERWPLIVHLHGGGNATDTAQSLASGLSDLRAFSSSADGDRFLWMAAVVRTPGSFHAWAMEDNALDMIDAIREVARLFRVDHTRVYLVGTSMGGGGVATLSYVFPEAFAAYAPVVGYYWNDLLAAPDLDGASFRIVAGELDRPPGQPFDRLGLAQAFASQTGDAGAEVTLDVMSGVGHAYPIGEVGETNEFFLEHARDTPPDWVEVRAQADALLPLFRM